MVEVIKKIYSKGKKPSWGIWQTIFVAFIAYFLAVIIVTLLSILFDGINIGDTEYEFIVYAVFTAVLLAVSLRFMSARGVKLKEYFHRPSGSALLSVIYYYLIYMALTILVQALLGYLSWYDVDQTQDVGFDNATGGLALALVFGALVILPPLGEEVLFRGIIYPGLRTKLRKIVAAVLTSLLFGLAHLQWNVGVDTFVLSMVVILAYEKQKTIWVPIGVHALKNFVAFLFLFVF